MAAEAGLAIADGAQMIALGPDDPYIEGGDEFARVAVPIPAGTDHARLQRGKPLAGNTGAGDDVLAQESRGEMMEFLDEAAMAAAPLQFHAESKVVDALLPAVELIPLADEDGFDANAGKGVGRLHEAIAGGAENALIEGVYTVSDIVQGGGDEFGGGRGRGSAQIGDEVCDGEVGLVADGGDDGKLGVEDGLGEELGVERCEVFERAAAAGNDDDVDGARAVEVCDAGGDFRGSPFALDECRVEQHMEAGVAAIDDVDEVADDGAGG